LKQKKQKFKSPPYASFAAQSHALQSQAAPRAVYICPDGFARTCLRYVQI